MDKAAVTNWLALSTSSAWKSYDPDAISDLFSQDVRYYSSPFSEPVIGRDAVVASWLKSPIRWAPTTVNMRL